MVEFVLVGNGVKLTALHLPEGGRIWTAGVDVAQAIALPFPGAVFPAKLWSTQETDKLFVLFPERLPFFLQHPLASAHACSLTNHALLYPQNSPFT